MRQALRLLAVVVVAAPMLAAQSSPSLQGAWEGQLLLNNNWRFMEGQFGPSTADARVDLPQERREFADFSVDGLRVRWILRRGQTAIRFEGTREGDVIRGRAEQNGVSGEFQLVRTAGERSRDAGAYAGTYRTNRGDLVTVARFDFGDDVDRLALVDVKRGYWGTLLPTGPSTFVFAPARSGRFPVSIQVQFSRDPNGGATAVTVKGPNRERISARRVELYETKDVAFANGPISLAGTVIRSRVPGPRPALVMVHSSGNQSRNGPNAYFRLIANMLAARGVTTLVYDKRGVGDSTGTWTSASFDDLASDARAALVALRAVPGVDPMRVGLWTLSQGGWIAPLVAASDSNVAFLALVSAAATSPAQQEIDRVAAVMRTAGSPQPDIVAASNYLRLFFDVVSGTQPWDVLADAIARTGDAPWITYVPRPRTSEQAGWAPAPATLDPASVFKSVRVPVLTIHGLDDVDVPAEANAQLFGKLTTHRASRQRIYPSADHYLLQGVTDPDRQYRRLTPDYLDDLSNWIHERKAIDPPR